MNEKGGNFCKSGIECVCSLFGLNGRNSETRETDIGVRELPMKSLAYLDRVGAFKVATWRETAFARSFSYFL